ncbi:hypothetical protein EJ08DRAFT_32370 [Tothia fuscella]|uniref:Uncharacterized protein n=1 Tax=Tothia fuscella TaxID=1048955 RepID=A0A9P4TTL4_9PEZI|nr:hypothetical protein EJ08DRAFT_32370 [Tothia fuscella]
MLSPAETLRKAWPLVLAATQLACSLPTVSGFDLHPNALAHNTSDLGKRAPSTKTFHLTQHHVMTGTWSSRIVDNSVDEAKLREYAKKAYEMIPGHNPINVAAALYVPPANVFIGTIVRGGTGTTSNNAANVYFKDTFIDNTPTIKAQIQGQQARVPGDSPYHAEVMANAVYEQFRRGTFDKVLQAGEQFPVGSMIVTYGRPRAIHGAGPVPACNYGPSSTSTSCKEIEAYLGVEAKNP